MRIQRLQWAGALIEVDKKTILIDPIYKSPNASFFGLPKKPFSPMLNLSKPNFILITHLHSDHYDPHWIWEHAGKDITLLVPAGTEAVVREFGFKNVIGLSEWQRFETEGVVMICVPAVDGMGDRQVSWIIESAGQKVIHCGDTLWHGHWHMIGKRYGPFTAAFLPVNGAVVNEPGSISSNQPICLTPEQAAAAVKVMCSDLLIPIHYGSFHHPPFYNETPHVMERVISQCKAENIHVKFLDEHESMVLEGKQLKGEL